MSGMATAVKVKAREAEKMRKKLSSSGLLDSLHKAETEGGFVYFPVRGKVPGHKLVKRRMARVRRKPAFRELLAKLLGKGAGDAVFSYDVIGDIAVLEVPEKFSKKAREIGLLLLESDSKLKAVFRKAGGREGRYRVTRLAHLAGDMRTETVHAENGVRMKVDIAKEYFTPRLAAERKRVAGLVEDGEKVLVLFAGVGPYALAIAKRKDAEVAGIELNPSAVRHFGESIGMNKLRGHVKVVKGDVKKVVPKMFRGFADRVLMPLPHSAEKFLPEAIMAVKKGGIVHLYTIAEKEGGAEKAREAVLMAARKAKRGAKALRVKAVRPFSAAREQLAIDFRCT